MRWLIVLFLFITFHTSAQVSDTLPGSFVITVHAQYGFIIAHRPTVTELQHDHVRGLELEFSRPLTGDEDWQQPYLLPSYGVAYQFLSLGNPEKLGNGHAITGRILFPLNEHCRIRSVISSGLGIGYIEKPFNIADNFKNVAIGSHLNAVVSFSYRLQTIIGRKTQIHAGIAFTHFSNGSIRPPNLGINVPLVQAGISSYIGKEKVRHHRMIAPVRRQWIARILVAAGVKGLEGPYGLNTYAISSVSGMLSRTISHKVSVGGGIDFFYDRSLVRKLETLKKTEAASSTSFRSGIHAGIELMAGRISMLLQNGWYIVDQYKEDGSLYTRVGAQYRLTDRLSACFHLKSHFAKADFFETGFLYIIR
jgi:hypothetical protein